MKKLATNHHISQPTLGWRKFLGQAGPCRAIPSWMGRHYTLFVMIAPSLFLRFDLHLFFFGKAEKSWGQKVSQIHFLDVQHGRIQYKNSNIAPYKWYHTYCLAANWMIIFCYKTQPFYQKPKNSVAFCPFWNGHWMGDLEFHNPALWEWMFLPVKGPVVKPSPKHLQLERFSSE